MVVLVSWIDAAADLSGRGAHVVMWTLTLMLALGDVLATRTVTLASQPSVELVPTGGLAHHSLDLSLERLICGSVASKQLL